MTRNPRTSERLLIRFSVIPSLKYSVLESALEFTKGSTARDAMAAPCVREKPDHTAIAARATTAAPAAATAALRHPQNGRRSGLPVGAVARLDSVSRFNRARSARSSEAL